MSEPTEWMFCDFTTAGRNPIEEWVSQLGDAEEFFWSVLKANRNVENPRDWTQLRYLKGDARQHRLWELGFTAYGRAYRVIGFFGEIRKRAILLIGCFHKQQVYEPPDAINTAITRKKLLQKGKATAVERPIPINR